jgi:hypothetical protein
VQGCHRGQFLAQSCLLCTSAADAHPLRGVGGADEINAEATIGSCSHRMICHKKSQATVPRPCGWPSTRSAACDCGVRAIGSNLDSVRCRLTLARLLDVAPDGTAAGHIVDCTWFMQRRDQRVSQGCGSDRRDLLAGLGKGDCLPWIPRVQRDLRLRAAHPAGETRISEQGRCRGLREGRRESGHAAHRRPSPRLVQRAAQRQARRMGTTLGVAGGPLCEPQRNGWVLLPHCMPSLAVHLPRDELVTMLDRLRAKL